MLDHPVATTAAQKIATVAETAIGNASESWNKLLQDLEGRIERGEGIPDGMRPDELHKYKRAYRAITAKQIRLLSKTSMEKALGEVKRYNKPPLAVVKIVLAIFQLLNQAGLSGVIKVPTKEVGSDQATLWKFLRKQIELSKVRPNYLIGRMSNAVPAGIPADMSSANVARFEATNKLMDPVTHEQAMKASAVVGVLRKWVYAMLSEHTVEMRK
mmetsp:Transcript_18991/g.22724  ORF Transcript_18991/g.22724 Transcript_18991/m.22724 type:complete len:214 (+) Transcript_18991:2-643(+)